MSGEEEEKDRVLAGTKGGAEQRVSANPNNNNDTEQRYETIMIQRTELINETITTCS